MAPVFFSIPLTMAVRDFCKQKLIVKSEKLPPLSLIAPPPHQPTAAIEENERINQISGDSNGEFFIN